MNSINLLTTENSKNKTISELAVIILSKEWPLKLKDIHSKVLAVRKHVSLQATQKSLSKLVKEKVILKQQKKYQLNTQWLKQQTDFSLKTMQAYLTKNKEDNKTIEQN